MKHAFNSITDSPKTPGGISKSLLTPCRRIGLSRNFRKSGTSPFQSPLSSKSEVNEEQVQTRKRKEISEETSQAPENEEGCCMVSEVIQTPTRNVVLPHRKKSKTLLASINKCEENELSKESTNVIFKDTDTEKVTKQNISNEDTSTPLLKSKSKSKKDITPSKSIAKEVLAVEKENLETNTISSDDITTELKQSKEKSPNNLTKECIVVIQKKIFKKEIKEKQNSKERLNIQPNTKDTVFDSDSDDVPLINLNKDAASMAELNKTCDVDEDFSSTKPILLEISKPKIKSQSPAAKTTNKTKLAKSNTQKKTTTQSTFEEDDDLFETKKTILIRKSYDKVTKPQKAKSTGSITQRDIDDLKARIETKKRMLLARGMNDDTKELRDLIKKWKKGCQDALMELMDLMKSKFPDKQNIDYSEMMKTLNIPASLVGYDSDNECFLTPDDESIILAKV